MVCDRWLRSFENFLADMGPRPDGCTIDRIENDKNYEPGNCRWGTSEDQNNNRRTTRLFTLNGKTQSMKQWAMEFGLTYTLVRGRIRAGYSIEYALGIVDERNR